MIKILQRFLQWLCPHKRTIYKISYGEEKGERYNLPLVFCEQWCEDCGKLVHITSGLDWGHVVND